MGSSAKPGRRRAAAPALTYDRASGRRTEQSRRGWGRDHAFGCLVIIALVAGMIAFATAVHVWGAELWGEVAPRWPGAGYGFATTAGALLSCAVAGMIAALSRMNWKTARMRSLAGASTAALCGGVAVLMTVIAFGALPPRRRRAFAEQGYGESGWVNEQYPYVWAVGILATALTAVLIFRLAMAYGERRKPKSAD